MSVYISRGVEHDGSSEDQLAGWSEARKDEAASMILKLVRGVVDAVPELRPLSPEPTGTGHIDGDVRDAVMKRSA